MMPQSSPAAFGRPIALPPVLGFGLPGKMADRRNTVTTRK